MADGTVTVRQVDGVERPIDNEIVTNDLGQTVYRQKVVAASRFTRLLKFEPSAGEEIRRDEGLTDDYHGAAPDGSATTAPVWDVVRFYKTGGLVVRARFRTGVVWDNRMSGW